MGNKFTCGPLKFGKSKSPEGVFLIFVLRDVFT